MSIIGRKNTTQRKYNTEEIKITNEYMVEKVLNFKYLGIIIDNKLNWNKQVI